MLRKLCLSGARRTVQEHRAFRTSTEALEDLLGAESPGGVEIFQRIRRDRGLERVSQLPRERALAAPDCLHDGFVTFAPAGGLNERRSLDGRFELRAGNAIDREDLHGRSLTDAKLPEPFTDNNLLSVPGGLFERRMKHKASDRVIGQPRDI